MITPTEPSIDGAAFWAAIFGNDAPVEIEIGSGDGTFLLARGMAGVATNLLGIERSPGKARRLAARLARAALPWVRMLQADATHVLALVPDGSVRAYHVYFPDPWPKRRHRPRQLFSSTFVASLTRTLADDGELYVATDVAPYMARIHGLVLAGGGFVEVPNGEAHPGLSTAFARKYRADGRPLYAGRFLRTDRRAALDQPAPAAVKIRSS